MYGRKRQHQTTATHYTAFGGKTLIKNIYIKLQKSGPLPGVRIARSDQQEKCLVILYNTG
jgi:hypothetical protein